MERNKTIILAAIVLSLIAGTSFTVTYLVDQNSQKENPIYISDLGELSIVNDVENVSNIEITNKIKDLDVSFEFLPQNSPLIINATWNYTYTESLFVSDNPIQIEISNETEDNILYITFDEDLNGFSPNLQNWECVIQISQDFETYSFLSDSKGGDINFQCDLDITFEKFEVITTSGEMHVQTNHTKIENDIKFESKSGDMYLVMDLMLIGGDLICKSDSGFIYFDLWDLKFLSEAHIIATANEGYIFFRWVQHIIHNNNVNITIETNSGIDFRHWCPKELVKYEIIMEAETTAYLPGYTNIELWNQIGGPNHLQSINFNETGLNFLQVSLKSFELDIYARILDCFKPVRFCDHSSDVPPWEVYEIGTYNITEAENSFSGTAIELYNNTANVNFTTGSLDASSTNLFEAYWDLTYMQGVTYGLGTLKINCSYEIVNEVLEIYINLDYAYDRIRPFYKRGNFTALFHPNYTYSVII